MSRPSRLDQAIILARREDYLHALTVFVEVYGASDGTVLKSAKGAAGLSFFALCLALVQRKFKDAIDVCKRAIELEFYNGDHYANLARIYVAAGHRRKALETAESGLKLVPDHEALLEVRREIGVRARPSVPFLDRANPINVTLGQSRHARKTGEPKRKKD